MSVPGSLKPADSKYALGKMSPLTLEANAKTKKEENSTPIDYDKIDGITPELLANLKKQRGDNMSSKRIARSSIVLKPSALKAINVELLESEGDENVGVGSLILSKKLLKSSLPPSSKSVPPSKRYITKKP